VKCLTEIVVNCGVGDQTHDLYSDTKLEEKKKWRKNGKILLFPLMLYRLYRKLRESNMEM